MSPQRLDAPKYTRSANSGGQQVVTLTALAAGKYRLLGGVTMRYGWPYLNE